MNIQTDITEIYNHYVDDMYTYALYLGFGEDDIIDAIHDVFCNLCYRKKDLTEISNMKFYLFKSLRNRLLDTAENNKKKIEFNSQINCETLFTDPIDTIESKLINEEYEIEIKLKIDEIMCI